MTITCIDDFANCFITYEDENQLRIKNVTDHLLIFSLFWCYRTLKIVTVDKYYKFHYYWPVKYHVSKILNKPLKSPHIGHIIKKRMSMNTKFAIIKMYIMIEQHFELLRYVCFKMIYYILNLGKIQRKIELFLNNKFTLKCRNFTFSSINQIYENLPFSFL